MITYAEPTHANPANDIRRAIRVEYGYHLGPFDLELAISREDGWTYFRLKDGRSGLVQCA